MLNVARHRLAFKPKVNRPEFFGDLAAWNHAAAATTQHLEAGGPFDEGTDGGALETQDEVAFPVAWYGSVVGFGWPFTDEDLVADKALSACTSTRPRDAERPTRA